MAIDHLLSDLRGPSASARSPDLLPSVESNSPPSRQAAPLPDRILSPNILPHQPQHPFDVRPKPPVSFPPVGGEARRLALSHLPPSAAKLADLPCLISARRRRSPPTLLSCPVLFCVLFCALSCLRPKNDDPPVRILPVREPGARIEGLGSPPVDVDRPKLCAAKESNLQPTD